MKLSKVYIVLIFLSLIFSSCKSKNDSPFTAKPVEMEIGKIKVVVDPNVEMMMILGRLSGAYPYNFENEWEIPYIDDIDKYFNDFKNEPVILQTRKNNLNHAKLPEFGIYLNQDISGYKLDIDNKNFIVQTAVNVQAKKIPYYAGQEYINSVKDFRIKSNFDDFFVKHKQEYERLIHDYIKLLKDYNYSKWLEFFYGTKTKESLVIHLTYLTNGGNFSITTKNKKGNDELHAVIVAGSDKNSFLWEMSHEYSHCFTIKISEQLYKNKKIEKLFNKLFNTYNSIYRKSGYDSGFLILNETITQACANKYLETILSPFEMKGINMEIIDDQKWIYTPQIAEFLDNYENDRKKYRTLDDFIPELEKFIEGLNK